MNTKFLIDRLLKIKADINNLGMAHINEVLPLSTNLFEKEMEPFIKIEKCIDKQIEKLKKKL